MNVNLKKIFSLGIIFLPLKIFSQIGYIPVEDEIYNFLERMSSQQIITNYNSFELPKTRKEISKYLIEIKKSEYIIDDIDQLKFNDFLSEFELDIFSTLDNSESLIPNWDFNYLFSEKEKFLYKYSDTNNTSLFVNFIGKLDFLNRNEDAKNLSSLLYRFGGEIRGTLFDKIGFSVNTTNGSFSGNKDLAQSYSSLKYNYKFNLESGSQLGDNYFDETSSFISADFDFAKIKFGNDRKFIGHGFTKTILSDIAPRMEYLELNLKYKQISFSFFHSKLMGNISQSFDSIRGLINYVDDKYLAYHRLGLDFGKHLQFGAGEMIIYANRKVDFSYLNPFNFYKSSEHANQDRDNTFLFFDFQNNSFEGLKFYSTILLDDIDFGKIGSGWYGNQSLITIGAYSTLLYKILPLDIELQYLKIDPYVFTHRLSENNFTNSNFALGTDIPPNSSTGIINFFYRLHHRINLNLSYKYSVHGANVQDSKGNIKNFGGDILLGHRFSDPEEVYLLKGEKEILRLLTFSAHIEPIKNWIFMLNMNFTNNSLARSQHLENFFTTFSLYTKI
ncbi:MAG: hypothetical protein IPH62_15555 [Ignavibacteriae bacterium]|nr:hypothetical protein [Ignavibacteriota bacterium]